MDEHTLYAARDPQGIRPLVLGRLERGWVVASETAALDIVGASLIREVEPGELIVIDEDGLRSQRFAETDRKGCVFEYVYLARPDTTINGRGVHESRVEMGRTLAREHPVEADLVMPTPESGTPAAIGYAQESGIPYGQGLVKNSYVGRTFIAPSQTIRQLGIRLKLNPLREVIKGKRLVVVDDSIVRGNTQRALVRMLREAGAAEVHVRISSPPVRWPCFYGIDFATRAELIATGIGVEEVCTSIGADSLGYISEEGMIAATEQPGDRLCTACFTGTLPARAARREPAGQEPLRDAAHRRRRGGRVASASAAAPKTPSPAPDVPSPLPLPLPPVRCKNAGDLRRFYIEPARVWTSRRLGRAASPRSGDELGRAPTSTDRLRRTQTVGQGRGDVPGGAAGPRVGSRRRRPSGRGTAMGTSWSPDDCPAHVHPRPRGSSVAGTLGGRYPRRGARRCDCAAGGRAVGIPR